VFNGSGGKVDNAIRHLYVAFGTVFVLTAVFLVACSHR